MAFQLATDDFDPDDVGGKDRVMPGFYHMLVENVDEEGGKNGAMRVDFQVLRSTTPGQESKIFTMDFSKDYGKWQERKLAAFGIGTGLFTMKQLTDAKANRTPLVIEWTEASGRTCCMEIEADDDGQYKGMPKLSWDNIWHPADKRASRVPLHAEALKRQGITLPAGRHIDGMLAAKAKDATSGKKESAKKSSAAAAVADVSTDELLEGVI